MSKHHQTDLINLNCTFLFVYVDAKHDFGKAILSFVLINYESIFEYLLINFLSN